MPENMYAPDGGLFQSELWKDFQGSLGKEIFVNESFWGTIQSAPILGCYGEISRGPDLEICSPETAAALKQIANEQNLSFIRFEPQYQSFLESIRNFNFRLRKAPLDAQPREFLMLALTDEESLFKAMKAKVRYNIRLAEKKGVRIKFLETEEEERQALNILSATARRKNISFHHENYYRDFIRFFSGEKGKTFIAVEGSRVLSVGAMVFFGRTAYYAHGGSSDEGRNLMAPHLLQWEQIRYALSKGYQQYDFGGTAKEYRQKGKDWSGITRFKTGFAPNTEPVVLPGTYDLVFSPFRYYAYYFLLKLKKKIS